MKTVFCFVKSDYSSDKLPHFMTLFASDRSLDIATLANFIFTWSFSPGNDKTVLLCFLDSLQNKNKACGAKEKIKETLKSEIDI